MPLGNRKVDVLDIVRQVLCVVKSIRGRSSLSFFCIFKLYDAFFSSNSIGHFEWTVSSYKKKHWSKKNGHNLIAEFLAVDWKSDYFNHELNILWKATSGIRCVSESADGVSCFHFGTTDVKWNWRSKQKQRSVKETHTQLSPPSLQGYIPEPLDVKIPYLNTP